MVARSLGKAIRILAPGNIIPGCQLNSGLLSQKPHSVRYRLGEFFENDRHRQIRRTETDSDHIEDIEDIGAESIGTGGHNEPRAITAGLLRSDDERRQADELLAGLLELAIRPTVRRHLRLTAATPARPARTPIAAPVPPPARPTTTGHDRAPNTGCVVSARADRRRRVRVLSEYPRR